DVEKKDDTNDLDIEVELSTGRTIEGRVLDAHDAPVAGFDIVVAHVEAFGLSSWDEHAKSRNDGAFVVAPCSEGQYLLRVKHPGEDGMSAVNDRDRRVRAKCGDRNVVLHARAGATLAGEVRFDGEPPDEYVIEVDGRKHPQPGSSSAFRIPALSAGQVQA